VRCDQRRSAAALQGLPAIGDPRRVDPRAAGIRVTTSGRCAAALQGLPAIGVPRRVDPRAAGARV